MANNLDRFFLDLQQATADMLAVDAWFERVPILTENLGDLANAIDLAIGKLGICVVITQPNDQMYCPPNAVPVRFEDVPIWIQVWENGVVNRDGDPNKRSFVSTALVILTLLLHNTARDGEGAALATQFYADKPTWNNLSAFVDREKYPGMEGVLLKLKCSTGYTYTPQATLRAENNAALLSEAGILLTTPRPFERT